MANVKTMCGHCGGTGQVDVTGVYLETLLLLRRRKPGHVVANQMHGYFGCTPTALNNRLAWLERHGLASSERYGRERRYKAV